MSDAKVKAIKALSVFEIDELPEMNVRVAGDAGAPFVKAFLEERLQDAINELVEAVHDRITAMDKQSAIDMAALRERDQDEHNRNMENAPKAVREGFALANKLAARMDKINQSIETAIDEPGKKIKLENGVYFYSPDGITCYKIEKSVSESAWCGNWKLQAADGKSFVTSRLTLKAAINDIDTRHRLRQERKG